MGPSGCLIVIPARWGSTRLPGKPLMPLAGKPLLAWVVEAALQVRNASGVLVATDHPAIAELARAAGAQTALTSAELRNGTERLLAITAEYPADWYVNLQGDEPLIHPHDLERLITALQQADGAVISLAHPITPALAAQPSRVKAVCATDGRALYFSRSPIPHGATAYWQHVGVYGFTAQALERIRSLGPTALEQQEQLEQLRWLEAGMAITLLESSSASLGVDTPEDALEVGRILKLRQIRGLLCDVDGVLTDGRLWYGPGGEEHKAFHACDAHG